MTAAEFDKLIREIRAALEARGEPPERLEARLLARLREEKVTSDSTVLEVVHAWRHYESGQSAPGFPRTRRLIAALTDGTACPPLLQAQLAAIRGDILRETGELREAAKAFGEAVDGLHGLHLEIDQQRMSAMVALGQLLLSQGNKRDAEKLFLDVLSYPWYLVMEAEPQALLRHDYLSAGLGLIDCRRGDLAGLQEIFFVPATQDELLPTLIKAINEAQAKQG